MCIVTIHNIVFLWISLTRGPLCVLLTTILQLSGIVFALSTMYVDRGHLHLSLLHGVCTHVGIDDAVTTTASKVLFLVVKMTVGIKNVSLFWNLRIMLSTLETDLNIKITSMRTGRMITLDLKTSCTLGSCRFNLQAIVEHHTPPMYTSHYSYLYRLLWKYIYCNDDGITECYISDIS